MSLPSSLSVSETTKILVERRPVLEPVLRTFEPVIESFGRLAGELAAPLAERGVSVPELDLEREAQGVSLLAGWDCAGIGDCLAQSARGMLPLLVKTDALKKSAGALEDFFAGKATSGEGRDAREALAQAVLSGDDDAVVTVAEKAGIDAEVLKFAGEMCLSPVLRAMVDACVKAHGGKNPWDAGNRWQQGYCPVCGAFATIAWLARPSQEDNPFLQAGGGRRHLHCGACGADWLFKRIACPSCGSEDKGSSNIFKQSGANFGERIDWCEKCKAYLPTIDFRESEHVLDLDVLALGMMHLDMVAHDKQLRPLKVSFGNAL
ncbi:MAG: formate dehydrogenase accessory protein FdhE [Desulfovibrio sp.]|nr:formate dehydrogenase accessory protein FdhE [Desulfovibrio sp.]